MASTIMLATAKRKENKRMRNKLYTFLTNASAEGIAVMSLDVLDYSVIHLSAYERSNRKFARKLRDHDPDFNENDIDKVKKAGDFIEQEGERMDVDPRANKVLYIYRFFTSPHKRCCMHSTTFLNWLTFTKGCGCDAVSWGEHGGWPLGSLEQVGELDFHWLWV